MTEAVIYTRVSSREQEQEGFSLGAQSKLLREYAERHGMRIVQAFEDVETAKAAGRKQFGEMVLRFKQNRACRVLLVEKTDRLYRNFRDAVAVEDLDIEVHFVKDGQILSKESKSQAKLIHGIHLVMAKNYSENLREEVKKGMREKASQGIFFPVTPPSVTGITKRSAPSRSIRKIPLLRYGSSIFTQPVPIPFRRCGKRSPPSSAGRSARATFI